MKSCAQRLVELCHPEKKNHADESEEGNNTKSPVHRPFPGSDRQASQYRQRPQTSPKQYSNGCCGGPTAAPTGLSSCIVTTAANAAVGVAAISSPDRRATELWRHLPNRQVGANASRRHGWLRLFKGFLQLGGRPRSSNGEPGGGRRSAGVGAESLYVTRLPLGLTPYELAHTPCPHIRAEVANRV